MMDKKIALVSLAIFALLGAATAFLFQSGRPATARETNISESNSVSCNSSSSRSVLNQASMAGELSDPKADALFATFGSVGQEYILHSRQYQQGEARVEDAPSLNWDGDMKLLVQSAQILPFEKAEVYEENDPRGSWSSYVEQFQDPCILRLSMRLENTDAHNRTGVQYRFNASMFFLSAYEDLMTKNRQDSNYITVTQRLTVMESYFDKNSGTKDYWAFELRPGESMDFVLEFLVDRSYFEQQSPFLAVSFNWDIKAGVLLDSLLEE